MGFLQTEDALGVIQRFNPWWTGGALTPPRFRRLAFDACWRYFHEETLHRGVLLSGARRVGKTTVLFQFIAARLAQGAEPRRLVYLSLDHPVLRLWSLDEIVRIFDENLRPGPGRVDLLLDEVQYVKDWDLHLKTLIDHRPDFRLLATGSAALRQRTGLIDSGVGRWITVPMPTLSFYEFLQIRERVLPTVDRGLRPTDLFAWTTRELTQLAAAFRDVLPEFQRYMLVGGFPETAKTEDIGLCQRILREDVVQGVLKRDMTALFGVRKVYDLEKLFIYLCIQTGGLLSVKTCARELGTTAVTVESFLGLLESAHLIYRLPPADLGGKKVLRQQSKVYLADAALRNAILLRGEETLTDTNEMGKIVETSVLRHLYAYYYLDSPQIGYWRDPATDKEVDVVVRSPAYVLPVEVKYRQAAEFSPESGLARYLQLEPAANRAYLVTREDRDFGKVQAPKSRAEILRIPAHVFTYLLGQAEHRLWQDHRLKPVVEPELWASEGDSETDPPV